ncbi:MAG TPA: hypothetical protein VMW08_15010 [Acidimicrobiales bacterium]|nr:hypothetical protein [Acidimicrobiales bacterium]
MRRVDLSAVIGAGFALWGFQIGSAPFSDNSFFTHLATGRLILDRGGIPRVDPYSTTAAGADWVVQSWLFSGVVAGIEELAGPVGIQVFIGLLTAILGALAWRLTADAESIIPRIALTAAVVGVGSAFWSERPALVGLIFLAVLRLRLERRTGPTWWIVPMMWVWVNVHGSFPLGVVLVAVWLVGNRADRRTHPQEKALALTTVGGVLLGAVNPLGLQLLLFPVELLGRSEVLRVVIEWQAPGFDTLGQQLFLLILAAAIVGVARSATWTDGLVVSVFVIAALLGSRNLPVAALLIAPVAARGLRGVGTIRGDRPLPFPAVFVTAAVLLFGVAVSGRSAGAQFNLRSYPVRATAYLEAEGLSRPVTADIVGNFRELLFGEEAEAYFDDRFDMYPPEFVTDSVTLLRARPGALDVLAEETVVLWESDAPLATVLRVSPEWTVRFSDEHWVVFERR